MGSLRRVSTVVFTAAVALLVLYLAARDLSAVPAPWYDEGINLQAARTLARTGVYGLVYDASQPRAFDVQLTTGPTVIAPVAIVFKTAGVGLTRGRLVMLAYTVLACLGLYMAARLLYGHVTGVVGLLVLSATELAGPASTRDVVGEVAALAFLFWGVVCLAVARAKDSVRWHIVAGLCLGLAALSKGQFGLLAPALAIAWILDWRTRRAWRFRDACITVLSLSVPIALWQVVQLVALGIDGFVGHLHDQTAAVAASAGAPFMSQTVGNIEALLRSHLAMPGLVGLAYVALRANSAERLVVATFAVLWTVWYVAFSVGYMRYTVPLMGVLALCLAVLACDVVSALRGTILRLCAGLLLAVPVLTGLSSNLTLVSRPPEPFAEQIAVAIGRVAEPEAITESLEWELDILTERPFHHPPPFVPLVPYVVPDTTRYLVDGPASKATRLYVRELAEQPYTKLASTGPYDLYQRTPQEGATRAQDR